MSSLSHGTLFTVEGWRLVSQVYLSDPISGNGALKHGHRYNPPKKLVNKTFQAVYFSENLEAARSEFSEPDNRCVFQIDGKFNSELCLDLSLEEDQRLIELELKQWLLSLNVEAIDISALIDREAIINTLNQEQGLISALVSEFRVLNGENKLSITQLIGIIAWKAEFQAIRYPSAPALENFNWVVYPDNLLTTGSYLRACLVKDEVSIPWQEVDRNGLHALADGAVQ